MKTSEKHSRKSTGWLCWADGEKPKNRCTHCKNTFAASCMPQPQQTATSLLPATSVQSFHHLFWKLQEVFVHFCSEKIAFYQFFALIVQAATKMKRVAITYTEELRNMKMRTALKMLHKNSTQLCSLFYMTLRRLGSIPSGASRRGENLKRRLQTKELTREDDRG